MVLLSIVERRLLDGFGNWTELEADCGLEKSILSSVTFSTSSPVCTSSATFANRPAKPIVVPPLKQSPESYQTEKINNNKN